MYNGVSFFVGLYALLITIPDSAEVRAPMIDTNT